MKRFIAFVIKETKHLLRDLRTLFVLFTIPIVQLLLFGYVISTEIRDAKIAILDKSHDQVTREITNKLLSSGYFILEERLETDKEIETIFRKNIIKEVVVFGENFEKKLLTGEQPEIQILTDASDPNTASMLDNYTRAIISDYQSNLLQSMSSAAMIDVEYRMFYNEELRSAHLFVPGVMVLILMLVCALMTSVSIAREKELGTMEILLVSPLKPLQIVLGKLVPYMVLSFIDMLVIIIIGYWVFKVPVNGSATLLIGAGTLFILLALTIGVLISTFAKTQQVAMLTSLIGMLLPTILLSGFIFPIENMPKVLQVISLFMPPRWFLAMVKDIMLKGAGFSQVWHYLLIIFGMLVFFIIMSVRNFKIRLQ